LNCDRYTIRYLVLLPAVFLFGLITLPITLLFKWNGYFILAVAHYEWCSLSKAKRLLLENKDNKYTLYCGYSENGLVANHNQSQAWFIKETHDQLNSADIKYRIYICNAHHKTNL